MKFNYRSVLCMILAAASLFTLAGCGGTATDAKPQDSSAASPATAAPVATAAEASDAPEFVYVSDYKPLDLGLEDYISVQRYTEDGVYGTISEKVGQRELREGETLEYEGQLDVYETRLIFISYDGKLTRLEGYKPIPSEAEPEGVYGFYSGSYLVGLMVTDDGNLIAQELVYSGWNDVEEIDWNSPDADSHYFFTQKGYIRVLDPTGAEISSAAVQLGDDFYFVSNCLDKDGNFFIISSTGITAVNSSGEQTYTVPCDGNINSLYRLPDGRIAVTLYGSMNDELRFLDDGKLSEASVTVPNGAYWFFSGGGDYPLYYNNGLYLYGYDPEDSTNDRLFSWLDCDVNPDSIASLYFREDGAIVMLTTQYRTRTNSFDNALIVIEKKPYEAAPHKTELTLATQALDWNTQSAIIDFNRANDAFRIKVLDYSQYNTDGDYSAGLTKLTTEIVAGNCPDIIDLNSMPTAQLAAKGIIVDLYPFIDADPELNREDFFENILKAFEVNGKLVSTVSSFGVSTVMGAARIVGDEPGWTYNELLAALESMPEGCEPFDVYTTRDTILETCLNLDMSDFVNWETGEVSFDCEEFISMLEFAALFPEEYDWDTYDASGYDDSRTRISEGRQMLMAATLFDWSDLIYNGSYFGGDVTYVGYPSENGTGSMVTPTSSGYAISFTCKDPDAAWKFLRTFFTEDYQLSVYGFPISKALYQEKRDAATTVEYQTGPDGSRLLDANGEPIPVAKYGYVDATGEWHEVYSMSEQEASEIDALINTTSKARNTDESIISIVKEQAAAFFAGQKTAAEAARLVQSKANIYVNEQR